MREFNCDGCHRHPSNTLENQLPSSDQIDGVVDIFKAVGDSTRARLIYALLKEEMCVCDLQKVLGMTQSAISHQLRVLRMNHIVKSRREGKSIFYSVNDDHVAKMLGMALEHILHTQKGEEK